MNPAIQNKAAKPSMFEDAAGGVLGVVKAVRKHWALVAATVLLSVGIALLYSKTQRPVFQAVAMLEINPHATQPLGEKTDSVVDMGAGLYWDSREYYETQYKIITSDRVLSAVARDLALASDDDFMGYKHPAPNPESLEAATAMLRGRVTVEPIKYSRLVLVKVDDTNPRRAKEICDAVGTAYIDQNLQNSLSGTTEAVTWLNGQIDHLKWSSRATRTSSTNSSRRTTCRAHPSTSRPTCSGSRCRSSTRR